VPYLARISLRISPRESPKPRDDYIPLFLLVVTVVAANADLNSSCALTRCPNELKSHLFILNCPMTFLAGPT